MEYKAYKHHNVSYYIMIRISEDMKKLIEIEDDTMGECELSIEHPELILSNIDNFVYYLYVLIDRIKQDGIAYTVNRICENVEADNFTLEQGYALLYALDLSYKTGRLDFLRYLREETKAHDNRT